VLVSGCTGAASWVFESPYLSHTFRHVHLPVIGEFELTSAMIFELGILLTVVGTVMLILAELGQLSLAARAPLSRPPKPECN
jgi:multicomponent K+:H+ antiporter subunit A